MNNEKMKIEYCTLSVEYLVLMTSNLKNIGNY